MEVPQNLVDSFGMPVNALNKALTSDSMVSVISMIIGTSYDLVEIFPMAFVLAVEGMRSDNALLLDNQVYRVLDLVTEMATITLA